MTLATLARLCHDNAATLSASYKVGDCLRVIVDVPTVAASRAVRDGLEPFGVKFTGITADSDGQTATAVLSGMSPAGRLYVHVEALPLVA